MNIITNEKLISRNSRIAQITMIGGLLILAGGMYISFRMPEQFNLSLIALILGFILSQVGIYYSNRFSKRPRPYEELNKALKGLDSKYTIFHYNSPATHLLVGPAGIWVLSPRSQRGTITFSKGKWKQKGGNLYLKIFAQEGLGRPDLEIKDEVGKVERYLQKIFDESEIPQVKAALIFTHEDVTIKVDEAVDAPAETIHLKKVKDYLRKVAKTKPISMVDVKEITKVLSPTDS